MLRLSFSLAALTLSAFLVTGCGSTETKPKPKPEVGKKDAHDDHGEGHHHPGPNKGLVAEFGKHKYHVEWTHNDATGDVNLYILDKDKQKAVAIDSAELVVVTKEGTDAKEYTLAAVDPQDGKASQFKVTDKTLSDTIEVLSEAITAEIKSIKVGEEEFTNVKLVEDHDH